MLLVSPSVLCSPHSLGVVLSQGHGEYILLGNTSVEEGGSVPLMDSFEEKRVLLGHWAGPPRVAGVTASQVPVESRSELGCLVRRVRGLGAQDMQGPPSVVKAKEDGAVPAGRLCLTWGGSTPCAPLNKAKRTCQRTGQKA